MSTISCVEAVRALRFGRQEDLSLDPGAMVRLWELSFHVLYCPSCRESLPGVAQEMDRLIELLGSDPAEVIKLGCEEVEEWHHASVPLGFDSAEKTLAAIIHLLTCPRCCAGFRSFAGGVFNQKRMNLRKGGVTTW